MSPYYYKVRNSILTMRGMFTQLAAATAARGTNRPTIPAARAGLEAIRRLNPKAVNTDAVVAAT